MCPLHSTRFESPKFQNEIVSEQVMRMAWELERAKRSFAIKVTKEALRWLGTERLLGHEFDETTVRVMMSPYLMLEGMQAKYVNACVELLVQAYQPK